jgi:NAD(P)-dependent dehydrogenase (short-subunit alcohol dehydrogenase family)
VVTGAASGIGKAIASRLAREGASVLLADVNAEAGEAVTRELAEEGLTVRFRPVDVTSEEACAEMVAEAVEAWGGLDTLVNSAGIGEGSTIVNLQQATWDRVIDTNLKGTFLASKAAFSAMVDRGGGSIVNISSLAGLIGGYGMGVYAASKGGVIQLTKVLAVEGAPHKVRANALCPVWIDTPMVQQFITGTKGESVVRRYLTGMVPMGRFGTPEEVAAAALFIASDEASFITGVALPIDGGTLCR